MRSVRQHKRKARQALAGRWMDAAACYSAWLATAAGMTLIGEAVAFFLGARPDSVRYDAINALLAVVGLIVLCPLGFGIRRRMFLARQGVRLPPVEIFFPFGSLRQWARILLVRGLVCGRAILRGLGCYLAAILCYAGLKAGRGTLMFAFGCAALTVAGGFLSLLSLPGTFLCDYLMIRHPDRSAWQVFRESNRRMAGQKERPLTLALTFSGWLAVGLTGVALPLVLPYYEMTAAGLAAELMQE